MGVEIYRENGPILKLGKLSSVIQDHGYLKPTLPASNKYYLFSETETGAKPIVLLGAFSEIIEFLSKSKALGIENRIPNIPNIYLGTSLYIPGERFTGLFPLNDFIYQLVRNVGDLGTSLAPTGLIQQFIGTLRDLGAYLLEKTGKKSGKKSKPFKDASDMLSKKIYMRFHYLEGNGMKEVGQHKIQFRDLADKIQCFWKEATERSYRAS